MRDKRLHYKTPLLQTPFHPRTSAANLHGHWAAWAGYQGATDFGDTEMEYTAVRNAVSVYDLCPMVKYEISGTQAQDYLDRLLVRSVARLPVGAVHYTVWCDDNGKVMDDGTLFRLGETEFLLCCQERHLPWLLDSAIGYDVAVREVTEDIAALSLQGPCSAQTLKAAGWDVSTLKPFRIAEVSFQDKPLRISRTGFTGDLGYEIWADPKQALALWDHLMQAGAPWGIRPIGSDALDMVRIEAGFLIAGADFVPAEQALRPDRVRSPFELGLDWLIDWEKGHFNGRRALLAERESGASAWALVGLDIAGNVSAEGAILYHGKEREAGVVTAALWSPTLKRNIALAQLRRSYLGPKSEDLWVEIYAMRELNYVKLMVPARVTQRPFFSPARRRATPPEDF